MESPRLYRKDYKPNKNNFPIETPEIKTGGRYYFLSTSGLKYEVSFGKRKDNYLKNIVNFSVLSERFEDEYSETKTGEIWSVTFTVLEIVRRYQENHPYSLSYEFSGEYRDNEDRNIASTRTRFFMRALEKIIEKKYWSIILRENKVFIRRMNE